MHHINIWNNVCSLTLIRVLLIKGSKISELVNANHSMTIILLLYTVCVKVFIKVQCIKQYDLL